MKYICKARYIVNCKRTYCYPIPTPSKKKSAEKSEVRSGRDVICFDFGSVELVKLSHLGDLKLVPRSYKVQMKRGNSNARGILVKL